MDTDGVPGTVPKLETAVGKKGVLPAVGHLTFQQRPAVDARAAERLGGEEARRKTPAGQDDRKAWRAFVRGQGRPQRREGRQEATQVREAVEAQAPASCKPLAVGWGQTPGKAGAAAAGRRPANPGSHPASR